MTSFKAAGSVEMEKPKGRKKSAPTNNEKLTDLRDLMEETHSDSVRSAARKLNFSKSIPKRLLIYNLKKKPYKFHRAEELSEQHKIQRLEFSN